MLRARVRQQAAVAQLGLRALADADLDSLLNAAVGSVAEGLGVEYAKVLELLPDGTDLLLRAGVGWRDGHVGRATVGTGADSQAGYPLRSDEPVIVDDLRVETRFSGPALLREHGVVSGLSVIIHGYAQPFGVLGAHTANRRAFSRDDIGFLQAVANVVATAIERRRADDVRAQLVREREARAAAEAAEARYRPLFERTADAVIVTDGEGRFVEVNVTACELLGYTGEELLKMRLGEGHLVANTEWVRAEFASLQREGYWAGELVVRRKDGTTVPVDARVVRVDLPTGTVYRGTWRDISERRRLEQLRQEFMALVTHELRNPLMAITASAGTLRRARRYDPDVVEAIMTQADLLNRLVGDLVDSEYLDAGRLHLSPRLTNIVALAHAQAGQARRRNSLHTIRVEASSGRLIGHWDRERLAQVLQNLLTNAINLSPGGGVRVRLDDLGREVRVSISDQGPGLPAGELSRLFVRPPRGDSAVGRASGLGLDLYLTKGLVEAHQGWISVESAPGKGSIFTFTLPYRPEWAPSARPAALTPRQLEIARLVADGLSNREIAAQLGLAYGTGANHMLQVMQRLGFHARAQVAAWAVERGLYHLRDN